MDFLRRIQRKGSANGHRTRRLRGCGRGSPRICRRRWPECKRRRCACTAATRPLSGRGRLRGRGSQLVQHVCRANQDSGHQASANGHQSQRPTWQRDSAMRHKWVRGSWKDRVPNFVRYVGEALVVEIANGLPPRQFFLGYGGTGRNLEWLYYASNRGRKSRGPGNANGSAHRGRCGCSCTWVAREHVIRSKETHFSKKPHRNIFTPECQRIFCIGVAREYLIGIVFNRCKETHFSKKPHRNTFAPECQSIFCKGVSREYHIGIASNRSKDTHISKIGNDHRGR